MLRPSWAMVVISRYVLGPQGQLQVPLPYLLAILPTQNLAELLIFEVALTRVGQAEMSAPSLAKAKEGAGLCRSHRAVPPQATLVRCRS